MARLVYIPKLNSETWLHWSVKTTSSCLRDYRFEPPQKHRQYATQQVHELLDLDDSLWEMVENAPAVSEKPYWREQISIKNAETGLPTIDHVNIQAGTQRLLDLFKGEVGKALAHDDAGILPGLLKRWEDNFACILQKTEFNHWDNKDVSRFFSLTTGIGWQALMLDHCRTNTQPAFINTSLDSLDFSLIAMELNLGISSRNNPFQPNETNLIKPDGLAIRRDNSFAILEVKAPQDDADVQEAMLQALCGALAVYAKRQMIVEIAKSNFPEAKRIAFPMARIPSGEATMALYILISVTDKDGNNRGVSMTPAISDLARRIIQAWRPLKQVAFFFVDPNKESFVSRIPMTHVEQSSEDD